MADTAAPIQPAFETFRVMGFSPYNHLGADPPSNCSTAASALN
jgi:hypothetical protein